MTVIIVALLNGRTKDEWYAWVAERVRENYGYETPRALPGIYREDLLEAFRVQKEERELEARKLQERAKREQEEWEKREREKREKREQEEQEKREGEEQDPEKVERGGKAEQDSSDGGEEVQIAAVENDSEKIASPPGAPTDAVDALTEMLAHS